MKHTGKTCKDFIEELSSGAPVPGSGGASALTGAAGIAVSMMIGNMTLGKERYADVEADIKKSLEKAEIIKSEMLRLIDEDAAAIEALTRAHGLPKDDPSRFQKMEDALRRSAGVSIEIMRLGARAIDLCNVFAQMGNKMSISDTGISAILCKAAIQSSSLSLFANTKYMDSRGLAKKLETEATGIVKKYCPLADEIYNKFTVKYTQPQLIMT